MRSAKVGPSVLNPESRTFQLNLISSQGAVAPGLKPTYNKLLQAKSQLEKLELTQAWSLRETDLYEFQRLVLSIDKRRVDGKFVDSEGNAPDAGQSVCFSAPSKVTYRLY